MKTLAKLALLMAVCGKASGRGFDRYGGSLAATWDSSHSGVGTMRKLAIMFCLLLGLAVTAQAQSSYWHLQATSTGFQWVPPTGPPVCKYAGVMVVSNQGNSSLIASKYGTTQAWAQAQSDRLKSWGFNAAGQYSYGYQGWNLSGTVPYVLAMDTSHGSSSYGGPAQVTSNLAAFPSGMLCHSSFWGPANGQVDYEAPSAQAAYYNMINYVHANYNSLLTSGYVIGVMTDEGDNPYGINGVNVHEDYGYIIAAQTPSQAPPTQSAWASNYAYSNSSQVVVDSNSNYEGLITNGCTSGSGPSWPAKGVINAVTTGDGGCSWRSMGDSTDHTLYAKIALADFLGAEYGCSGSPFSSDPLGKTYCGSLSAATALAALNTAWGTSYTTWGTSNAGGLAGIKSGSYASYGTGTGFLDENGTHILSSAAKVSCNIFPTTGWAANAQITADLHSFMTGFAALYATQEMTAWENSFPTHPPLMLPVYDPPSYIASGLAAPLLASADLGGNAANVLWTGPDLNSLTDLQTIVTAMPGVPVIASDYSMAQLDSPYYATACTGVSHTDACFTSQALRGAGMVSYWTTSLHLKDTNGKYTVVGLDHWELYDQANESAAFGLVTLDGDNPYDGSAESNASVGSCATSTGYTAPTICKDSNNNYEALSVGVTSCTSGGSAPTWATQNGSVTTDGSCKWRNEGSYSLTAETTPIPSTAAFPGVGYGDAISPIATFLNGGICDPTATAPAPPTDLIAVPH